MKWYKVVRYCLFIHIFVRANIINNMYKDVLVILLDFVQKFLVFTKF